MRAMTYRGPFRVRVDNKPEPELEHPQDAIVRVTRAAICGSDIHLYHGLVPDLRVGTTFGHEFIGIVERVGPAVESLAPGDKVLVPFNIACGSCYWCSRSLTASCHNSNPSSTLMCGVYGYSHTAGGYDGGQAELRLGFTDPTLSRNKHVHGFAVCCMRVLPPDGNHGSRRGCATDRY